MILTKEQISSLRTGINFQMACVLDVAGKKNIKIKDLYDTIVHLMNERTKEESC